MTYLVDAVTLALVAVFLVSLGFVPYYFVADGARTAPGCFALVLGGMAITVAAMIAPYGHFQVIPPLL
jgi:hypothetical protein